MINLESSQTIDAFSRLKKIEAFLKEYLWLWQPPFLGGFPEPLRDIPENWVESYRQLTLEDMFRISNFKCTSHDLPELACDDFKNFILEIQELSRVPKIAVGEHRYFEDPIFAQQIFGLQEKKAHELKNIVPIILELLETDQVEQVVDIGGGKGFLSLAISGCKQDQMVVDMQEKLIRKCHGYFKRWDRKEVQTIVERISHTGFDDNPMIKEHCLYCGLHLCGGLSNLQIRLFQQKKGLGLVNFGCCYHKLTETEQNMSGANDLRFSASEFRLALVPYHYRSMETLQNNIIKNHYRFALYGAYQQMGNTAVVKKHLNQFQYPRYANEMDFKGFLSNNRGLFKGSWEMAQVLEAYEAQWKKIALEMEIFEFFRRCLSRITEVYLLCDRLLFLQNNDNIATMGEVFDGRISPRNIGIFAWKRS